MADESLEFVIEGEVAILKYDGEIIFENSNYLKEESKKKMTKNDSKNVIIDLEKVPYVDSSGIGFILSLFKFTREQKGNLVIANANEKIKKGLEITKISQIIEMYDSVEKAYENIS